MIYKQILKDKELLYTEYIIIKNLIRIKESEFKNNNQYLDFLIFKNIPRYLTNRLGEVL
jgi:hypothetical protein